MGGWVWALNDTDGTIRELVVDSFTLRCRDTSTAGNTTNTRPIDADLLAAWLKSDGVRGDATEIDAEVSLVMSQIHQLVSSPPIHQFAGRGEFGGMSSTTSSSGGSIPWIGSVPLLVAAIIWVIGLLRILLNPSVASTVNKSSPHII
jgi:hypothetical protein